MLPDNDAELRERVALLVKKGAARAAFAHLGPVDVRTGVGLEAQGLIDRQSGAGTVLDEDVIEVVTNRNSPRRNNSCPGPILFYRQRRDETKQFALDMTELLLSDHLNSRVGALDHFRLVTMTRETMTSKTISILNSTTEEILNPAPEVWRSAALGLYDAIRHDLLCIAAGARQSIEQHYEEGIQQYFPKLMRPAVLAIDGLGIPIVGAKELVPFATGLIQTIVESSSTFDAACDSYVDQVGFLPVAGSGSFSGFVQTWAEHRGSTVDLLAAVKAWKDRSSKPLAAFHACACFLNRNRTIGEDEKDVHWQDFIELIARSAKDFVDDKCSVWKFHAELARHFCHYLEVRLPGSQADAIPRIAMWLSNCVINLIGINEQAIAAFRNNGILSECYESEFNWRVANPPGIRSPLWIAIQGQAAIWAYALMVGLTTEEIREFRQFVKDDIRQAVERSFAVICVKDYVGHSDVTSLMSYDFERSFDGIAEAWIQEFGESDSLNSILSINSSRRRFSDASELAGALKSLAEDISEADKVFWSA